MTERRMRFRPVILAAWIGCWMAPAATGQIIDFESYPDGTPTLDGDVIFDQYAAHGVTFQLLNRNTGAFKGHPRITEVGAPRTAFIGCFGPDTPREGQSLGRRFLTDNESLGVVGDLLITYLAPVRQASGVIIDVDWSEQWTILALDLAEQELDRQVITAPVGPNNPECNDPPAGPGESLAFSWSFDRPAADIAYILLRYTGASGNVGLAFDLFSPGALPPPLNVQAGAAPHAVCAGESVTLSGEASGGRLPYRFEWQRQTDEDTWGSFATGPTTQVVPPVNTRYRLVVTDSLDDTAISLPLTVHVCAVEVDVSQESSPGAGDFDTHLLGTIGLHVTGQTTAAYYSAGSFAGPAPVLTPNRSHLFMLAAADGLALVVVHDATAPNGGGRAEMQYDLAGCTVQLLVRDDTPGESPDHYTVELDNTRLLTLHDWNSPNTDGLALGQLVGDWSMFVQFLNVAQGGPTIGGLDSWAAYRPDGSTVALQLAEGRRIRLRARRALFPDSDLDGVLDLFDTCPGTVLGAVVDAEGCPAVLPGDCERDGDVDAEEMAALIACGSGPDIPRGDGCACSDLDQDGDVDATDFGLLQRCYSGPGVPADPDCAP